MALDRSVCLSWRNSCSLLDALVQRPVQERHVLLRAKSEVSIKTRPVRSRVKSRNGPQDLLPFIRSLI